MKKTLVATAVLGMFTTAAFAAQVSVYGVIDTGISHMSYNLDDGNGTVHKTQMASGINAGSRWGLKGKEDLGGGYAVGFVLENGFDSDTGEMKSGGLWSRESTVSIYSPYGQFVAGRMCQIRGGKDSTASMFKGNVTPFATGWSDHMTGTGFVTSDANKTLNNAFLYKSPKFSGWQVVAQYSLANTAEGESADTDDRYMAVAAVYKAGSLYAQLMVDSTNLSQATDTQYDDPVAVSFAANYDFKSFKLYGITQYFKDSPLKKAGAIKAPKGVYDGYGLILAATTPLMGGELMGQLGYLSAEDATSGSSNADVDRYSATLGWEYYFNKRTRIYTGFGYEKQEQGEKKPDAYEVAVGLIYKF